MDITYNPFRESITGMVAELTSEKAQQYYLVKVQRDVQESIDAALTVLQTVYLIGQFAYDLGQIAGEWHHAAITAIELANEAKPVVLSGTTPVGLLPSATGRVRRLPSRVGPSGFLVTRPSAEILDGLTVRQLRGICRRAGLRPRSGARKAELVAMI